MTRYVSDAKIGDGESNAAGMVLSLAPLDSSHNGDSSPRLIDESRLAVGHVCSSEVSCRSLKL